MKSRIGELQRNLQEEGKAREQIQKRNEEEYKKGQDKVKEYQKEVAVNNREITALKAELKPLSDLNAKIDGLRRETATASEDGWAFVQQLRRELQAVQRREREVYEPRLAASEEEIEELKLIVDAYQSELKIKAPEKQKNYLLELAGSSATLKSLLSSMGLNPA